MKNETQNIIRNKIKKNSPAKKQSVAPLSPFAGRLKDSLKHGVQCDVLATGVVLFFITVTAVL